MNNFEYIIYVLFRNYLWLAILLLIIGFVIHLLITDTFANYAEEKGYSRTKYFWVCFLLMPLGITMIIAMPDKKTREAITKLNLNRQITKEEIDANIPKCRYCGTPLKENANYCVRCGNKVE